MTDTQKNIEYFKKIMSGIKREGKKELMDFIESSDFFTAPASTKNHGAYDGGLLQHSINVYKNLLEKKETPCTIWYDKLENIPDESIAIVGLLHDICKTYFYKKELRSKKVDGRWIEYEGYAIDDRAPYGHGEKSVMIIEQFMKLEIEERYAIRWHMGPYSGQQDWTTLGNAIDKHPLVLAVFEADIEAEHITETEK